MSLKVLDLTGISISLFDLNNHVLIFFSPFIRKVNTFCN